MTVISDSSPLISLASVDSLELLHHLFHSITVPRAVYDEVTVGKDKPGAKEVMAAGWIRVFAVHDQEKVKRLAEAAHLGRGESEVIVLAGELKARQVILDDWQAREVAMRKRLPVMGTLAVLLAAKNAGLIAEVEALMQDLIAAGKYVDPEVYREILRQAGEV